MPEFSQAEQSAIKAVTRHFSAKLQRGIACPPVTYMTIGGRRIALDVSIVMGSRPRQKRIATARLREDVVARRVLRDIESALRVYVPDAKVIILTLGAPIKVPKKLVAVLTNLVLDYLESGAVETEVKKTILGNRIRFRVVNNRSMWHAKVIGFVFSGDPAPSDLLNAMRTLLDEIAEKTKTPIPKEFAGERWLVLGNEHWIADVATYRWAYSRLSLTHAFKRILMVLESGRVEVLTEI